jgi:hypothetical protein
MYQWSWTNYEGHLQACRKCWPRIRLKRLKNTATNLRRHSLSPHRDSNQNIPNTSQNNFPISYLRRTRGSTVSTVEQRICSRILNLYDIFSIVFTVPSLSLWYLVSCTGWLHLKMPFHMAHIFLKLLAVFTKRGHATCSEGHATECWRSGRGRHDYKLHTRLLLLSAMMEVKK